MAKEQIEYHIKLDNKETLKEDIEAAIQDVHKKAYKKGVEHSIQMVRFAITLGNIMDEEVRALKSLVESMPTLYKED